MITQTYLKSILCYDQETGNFTYKVKRGNFKPGDKAGSLCRRGYLQIGINNRMYSGHRLAWLYTNGEFPDFQIDHIDGNPANNRIVNLRLASNAENQWNVGSVSHNTSSFKGIALHKNSNKWQAQCRINGKSHYLGLHETKELAHAAYITFAKSMRGEFYRDAA